MDSISIYERCRPQLLSFATRMTLRPEVAEEIVQDAAVRLISSPPAVDDDPARIRAWLFRVVSNLALDYLRRHSTWREIDLVALRSRAEADASFVAESQALRASAELRSIAREHLSLCVSCALRNVGPQQAAALLLREVHDFSVHETAQIVSATPVQVKNWIQAARRALRDRYADTCALVNKTGMCHQCVELDGFFNRAASNPLEGTDGGPAARLAILRDHRGQPINSWHRRLLALADEALTP